MTTFHKCSRLVWGLLVVCQLAAGETPAAGTGASGPGCADVMQKVTTEQLLDSLKDAHAKSARLYKRYMEPGGLLRTRAFQWATAEAGRQNLENGKSLVQFFDWKVSKSPEKLSEEIWRQMAEHYSLDFLAHAPSEAEAQRNSVELNQRLRRTGESQAEFMTKAREIAEIGSDPEKLAEFKAYVAKNLPGYGKAVIRYEVARRTNSDNLADLRSPLTIALGVGAPVAFGTTAGIMGQNPLVGGLAGLGAYGITKAWRWGKSFVILMDAMRRDRRVTRDLKKNLAQIDVEGMATQQGLDLNQYRDLIENAGSKVYEPYKSIVDEVPSLELQTVTFQPGKLDQDMGNAADHYSAFGSAMAALSMPLRTEIIRRSNEIMDAKPLGRLDKALEPVRARIAKGETVSQADVKGLVSGALNLRIEDLKKQARDMTKMEQDLRKVRDTARQAHGQMKAEAIRLYEGLDSLEKAGTKGLEDRFEDLGRIDAEVNNFDSTAINLEGATVAIGAARTLIEAELQAMLTAQKTIEINPGGQGGLIGPTLVGDLDHLSQIIADRKGYSAPRAKASSPATAASGAVSTEPEAVVPAEQPVVPQPAKKAEAPAVKPKPAF